MHMYVQELESRLHTDVRTLISVCRTFTKFLSVCSSSVVMWYLAVSLGEGELQASVGVTKPSVFVGATSTYTEEYKHCH